MVNRYGLQSGLLDRKKPPSLGANHGCPREGRCDIFEGSDKKMNVVYTPITFIVMHSSSFCQRLLGVRPGNIKTLETELTLFMMRPAG
jgi:hypothetical protein